MEPAVQRPREGVSWAKLERHNRKFESFFPQVPCKGYSTKEEIIVLRYQASVSKQIAPKIAQESKQGYMIYSKMRV